MRCSCGAEIYHGDSFCGNCGARITGAGGVTPTIVRAATQAAKPKNSGLKQFLIMMMIVGLLLTIIGFAGEFVTGYAVDLIEKEISEEITGGSDDSGLGDMFSGYLADKAEDFLVSVVRGDPEMFKSGVKTLTDLFEKGSEEDPFVEGIVSWAFNEFSGEVFSEMRGELIEATGLYWPLLQIVAYYPEFQMIGLIMMPAAFVLLLICGMKGSELPRIKKRFFSALLVTLVLVIIIAHINPISFGKQVVSEVKGLIASTQSAEDEVTTTDPDGTVSGGSGYGGGGGGGRVDEGPELVEIITPRPTATPVRVTATPVRVTPTPRRVTPTPVRLTPTPNVWGTSSDELYAPSVHATEPLYKRIDPVGRWVEVSVDSGHGRSGPGVEGYRSVAYINRGERYQVLDTQMGTTGKDWYKVRVGGKECWVSSGLVMIDGYLDGTSYGVPIIPQMVGRKCVIRAAEGNARTGPGTDYTFVCYVRAGQQYEILDCVVGNTGKDWYMVRANNGQLCWFSSELAYIGGYGGGTREGVLINPDAYR